MYVYSEMLALFARARYDTSLSDLSNLASHLTNTCRQPDAAEGQDAAASGAGTGAAPAAAEPASSLNNGHSSTAYSTAQRPRSGVAGSVGADSYSEADVVRLLSELPKVGRQDCSIPPCLVRVGHAPFGCCKLNQQTDIVRALAL